MTDKAVITLPDVDRVSAADYERRRAEELGIPVEYDLPQGTLVRADAEQRAQLDELGFRVTLLRDTNILGIGSYRIDIEGSPPDIPGDLRVPAGTAGAWPHHLVQLIAPPSEAWIREIEKQGVDVVEPISRYGLFVAADPETVEALRQLPFVAWVGPFQPAYRLHDTLQGRIGPVQNVKLGVYPAEAAAVVKEALAALDARIISESPPGDDSRREFPTFLVEISGEQLPALARVPNVRWLEFAEPQPELAGEREVQITAGNVDNAHQPLVGYQAWLTAVGLGGTGVCVAICDTGVDANALNNSAGHADLRGRQAAFKDYTKNPASTDTNGHGTHVASIAVGNAITGQREDPADGGYLWGLGVAPDATYVTQNAFYTTPWPSYLGDLTRDAVVNGAHIMNNSWTDKLSSGYTSNASDLDRLARDPDPSTPAREYLVLVCAAGNGGPKASTIWPPHEAKNIIAVGASNTYRPKRPYGANTKSIWKDSSRGPAQDGRTLPTVVAPGTNVSGVLSATSGGTVIKGTGTRIRATRQVIDKYTWWTGTSMASPHVAGCCAILIEWWSGLHGGAKPSPALLKAMLVNGAEDLEGGNGGALDYIPNNDQGWGRVNLKNMVQDAPASDRGPKLYVDQTTAFTAVGQQHLTRVAPVDTGRRLRITLVWTDAPGAVNSIPALVNDLNLEVREIATGSVYKGNVFSNGVSSAGGDFDDCNNVECVYIDAPGGTYEVRVIAAALKSNALRMRDRSVWQDFALVIDNAAVAGP